MPLDEATRRFAFLLQRDLRRISERRAEHEAKGEETKFDSVSGTATIENRRGDAVAKLYGEILAIYAVDDRILRWSWAGRASSASPKHGDVVFREGQARGVPQLSMSVVGDLDEEDATMLVKLGALVARAEGVHLRRNGGEIEYVGVFERPRPAEPVEPARESRFSVPPPPVVEKTDKPDKQSTGSARAYQSIPPIREIFEPRGRSPSTPGASAASLSSLPAPNAPSSPPIRKLREPSRALFLPVANAALVALARGSKGYLQGLFVVTLEADAGATKKRIVVQLVVVDAAGVLRALDPTPELLEAAVAMVAADLREGNGQWRRLSARISPKPEGGATLNVDVT